MLSVAVVYLSQSIHPPDVGCILYYDLLFCRFMWSDKTGLHSTTKESVRLPCGGWGWVGDWVIDHHTPGGTDKDGWQYATDFPASYHPEPTFTDYVRRCDVNVM